MSHETPPTLVSVQRTVRRYRKASGDGMPFIPYGLFPFLGLLGLLLVAWVNFAPNSIERVTRETAERIVSETGSDWASLRVSGQDVIVSGQPPTPEAGQRLLASIRAASAPTWLGRARPATTVTGKFGPASRFQNGSGADASGTPEGAPPEYLYRLSGTTLTLDGRMPDIATRDAVIDAANENRPAQIEEVVSNLETLGVPPPEGFLDTALRGVEVVRECTAGTASFADLTFEFDCELPEGNAERVAKLAGASLPYGTIGEISVLAKEVADSCEEELTRLLDAAHIEFETGSDRIASSKVALLDLTARAASDCPGRLRVEGHTDNTGSAAINDALSQRRAEAVRAALVQRGVAPSRLTAVGYGSGRPIGDNDTDEGRALNRRIEIHIERPGE